MVKVDRASLGMVLMLGIFSFARVFKVGLVTETVETLVAMKNGSFKQDSNSESTVDIRYMDKRCQAQDVDHIVKERQKRILETCSYYLEKLPDWHTASTSVPPIVAWQQRSGAGDRFAGLVSAFNHAMNTQRRLEIKWNYLNVPFEVPCWMQAPKAGNPNLIDFSDNDLSEEPQSSSLVRNCKESSCMAAKQHKRRCTTSTLHLVDPLNSIRACASEQRCRALAHWAGRDITLVHSIGCPLALTLNPSKVLLGHKLSFFLDGVLQNATLGDFLRQLQRYHVIGLHHRHGDSALMRTKKFDAASFDAAKTMEDSVACLKAVAQSRLNTDHQWAKPVRWLVASDNRIVRKYFLDTFPREVILLAAPPRHLHKVSPKTETKRVQLAIDTFSEWLALAYADELVANEGPHGLSAFSKLGRLWNLQSRFFAVTAGQDKCVHKEFTFEGALRLMPNSCVAGNSRIGQYTRGSSTAWAFHRPREPLL